MFEIVFDHETNLVVSGVRHTLRANEPLRLDRTALQAFYGAKGLRVRPVDHDGSALAPWLEGPNAIEDAIAIAAGSED